jgi:hypothetical protein
MYGYSADSFWIVLATMAPMGKSRDINRFLFDFSRFSGASVRRGKLLVLGMD